MEPIWKLRLQLLADRIARLSIPDASVVLVRNQGEPSNVINATIAEACGGAELPQWNYGSVDDGYAGVFIADASSVETLKEIFDTAGISLEGVPNIAAMFDPIVMKFPPAVRWCFCLHLIGREKRPGVALRTDQTYQATPGQMRAIIEGRAKLPKCWHATICNALARSVELLYLLCAEEVHIDADADAKPEGEPTAPVNGNRHSPDFRSVYWCGEDYTFTRNQAACIRVLWEAMENRTPVVGGTTITDEAGVDHERLSAVFRDHPAWNTMIVSAGKGNYRLQNHDAPEIRC